LTVADFKVRSKRPKTLPAKYFTDPVLFERELDVLFCRGWVYAGRAEAIAQAGDYFLCEVARESIVVLRDPAGMVRAFFNVCRHRGTRMCSEGKGNLGGRIQCPYHGWTYGLDGQLVAAPHMGADFARGDYPLHPVEAAEWAGLIFVRLSGRAAPLARHLGNLPEKFAAWRMQDLRLHRRIVYDVKANWKLAILNYSECLHCPLVHPALNRLTDFLGADNDPASSSSLGGTMQFAAGIETMSTDGLRRRDYLPGLNRTQRSRVYYYAVIPNLLLSLHPDYMMLHSLWPKAVDRTEIVCEWYFHPREMAKPGFTADDAVEFWDTTNREDWRVVELSQQGVQSRAYRPGPYSEREELLRAFDQIVLRAHRQGRVPRGRR